MVNIRLLVYPLQIRRTVSLASASDDVLGTFKARTPTPPMAATRSAARREDLVNGNGGDDVIAGGPGADALHGGRGDNVVFGGDGDNLIFENFDDDTSSGGAGADQFHLNSVAAFTSDRRTNLLLIKVLAFNLTGFADFFNQRP